MTKRHRFAADFKAKVALEALRGDRTIQEISIRHKVHPNQVSQWKKQAIYGLGDVFSNGAGKSANNDPARDPEPQLEPSMPACLHQPVEFLLPDERRE